MGGEIGEGGDVRMEGKSRLQLVGSQDYCLGGWVVIAKAVVEPSRSKLGAWRSRQRI